MRAQPRERFSSAVRLTPTMVAGYAHAVGDTNPMHHDPKFAASSRFGRLIASGTHTTTLLLGVTASHFSKHRSMVSAFYEEPRRDVREHKEELENDRLSSAWRGSTLSHSQAAQEFMKKTPNQGAPANRRYVSPLDARQQFGRAFYARPCSSAAVAELDR